MKLNKRVTEGTKLDLTIPFTGKFPDNPERPKQPRLKTDMLGLYASIALWGSCNGKLEIGIFHFLERNISGIFGHG